MASGSEGSDSSEFISKAMFVAFEAVFVQGCANLTTALIANTAATIANTSNKVAGLSSSSVGSSPSQSGVGSSSPAVTVMAAKTNKILEDILWQVSAIRAKSIVDQPTLAAKTDKDDKKKKDGPSSFGAVGNQITAKLIGALGPLTNLSQLVGSAASGFSVFTAAMNVVSATLAPIVLPVFLAMAGAALDFADALQGKLAPGIKQFAGFIFDVMIPALTKMIELFFSFTDALAKGINMIRNWTLEAPTTDNENANVILEARSRGIDDTTIRNELKKQDGVTDGLIDKAFGVANKETYRQQLEREDADKGLGGAAAAEKKRSGVDDALESFRRSVSPKASFSGLADVTKNAQLAALNTDPIQQKMLNALLDSVRIAEEGLEIARGGPDAGRPPVPRGAPRVGVEID